MISINFTNNMTALFKWVALISGVISQVELNMCEKRLASEGRYSVSRFLYLLIRMVKNLVRAQVAVLCGLTQLKLHLSNFISIC